MKVFAYLFWLGGLALAIGLVAYQGFATIAADIVGVGWGLAGISLFHFLPQAIDSVAWRFLFPQGHRPSVFSLWWKRWVGESVNNLLPAVGIGGYAARARLLYLEGTPGPIAGASVITDLTVSVLSLVLFALLGIGLLLIRGDAADTAADFLLGLVVFASLIAGFFLAQRAGIFRSLARVASKLVSGRDLATVIGGAERMDEAIRDVYRRRGDFFRSFALRLVGWIVGSGEVWLALTFLGYPVTVAEALLLESLGRAIRSAAFPLPGALGVQEGGYMLLGTLIGIGPSLALEVALLKRIREVVFGVPGLLFLHWVESRTFANRARAIKKP